MPKPEMSNWTIRTRADASELVTIRAAYPAEWPEYEGARFLAFKDDDHKVVFAIPVDILLDVRRESGS
jgi:hypothetical protein